MDTKVADNWIGALVDGRYRIRGRVASGGMATVYTAVDQRLERTVAVKIIHPGQAHDPRFVDRFTWEAKTIARLTHPNVVAVYDQGTHEGMPYLVMEYVRGRTLRDILTDERRLPPAEALAILEQMLSAVAAAHRAGVIHRDVKPENVLIATSPTGESLADAVVKVADFGLARAVEASAEEGDGQLLATVAYVAPELVTDGQADPRTDVYSIGIVLFEMVTGRVPYDGGKPIDIAWQHVDQDVPPPSKYVPGLPAVIDELVRAATRRDPAQRPADAGAMLEAVQLASERLEAQAGLVDKTVATPTIEVSTLARTNRPSRASHAADVDGEERPSWSRLPAGSRTDTAPKTTGGRRRADERAAAADRSAGFLGSRSHGTAGGSGFIGWFDRLMARRNGRRAFFATLGVLALVVILSGWWFGFGRYTSTPQFVGLTQTSAQTTAKRLGFDLKYGPQQFNEKVPKGTVLTQQPPANARVVRGGSVTLVLSKGPERYTIPDDTGKAIAVVQSDLNAIHMVVQRQDQYSDEFPTGYVISLSPKAGSVEPPNTTVTVVVSKGKAPITVPNVVGLDFNTANQQLTALGLQVAQTSKPSTTAPANQVIGQSIDQGSGVTKNTTIVLTVSSGPPQVPVPNVVNQGLNYDQAAKILTDAGLVPVLVMDFPGGQVRNQNPGPGTTVPAGTQVQLWVAP